MENFDDSWQGALEKNNYFKQIYQRSNRLLISFCFVFRYKDGRPYPWPGTVSRLILYPESANQTVYTPTVTAEDAGNYTCLLRNDSVVHSHTIKLTVFGKWKKKRTCLISPLCRRNFDVRRTRCGVSGRVTTRCWISVPLYSNDMRPCPGGRSAGATLRGNCTRSHAQVAVGSCQKIARNNLISH